MSQQNRLITLLEKPRFGNFIMGLIIFNAILLGLETSKTAMGVAGGLIVALDRLCLAIFVAELLAKMVAYRGRFFRDGWNLFDFVIVGISLVPAAQGFSALRALRILRVLRLVSTAPRLRRVVEGFITALPGTIATNKHVKRSKVWYLVFILFMMLFFFN